MSTAGLAGCAHNAALSDTVTKLQASQAHTRHPG